MNKRVNGLSFVNKIAAGGFPTAVDRLVLVLFCLLIFLPAMFRGLMNPDETRYAEIAREMAESGDWVVLHLNYVPFVEKPPLTAWLNAVSIRIFGFHPWVVRLAPLLAALFGVLMTYELGSSISSRRTGLIAAVLLATTALYYILAVSIVTDMVFSVFLIGAWWAFWRYYQEGGQQKRWIVFFWLFTAIACVAKGPLGLVLPGIAVVVFIALRREWLFVWKLRPFLGLLIVAAVNLPWMIALYLRDPRLLEFFYIRLHFSAIGASKFLHTEPWYYYLTSLPIALFPWSLPTVAALILAAHAVVRKGQKEASPGLVWLLAIIVGGFLFLHVSKAKLLTYILPLVPAMILILAIEIDKMDMRLRWVRWLIPVQCSIALVALVVVFAVSEPDHFGTLVHQAQFWIAILGGGIVAFGLVMASIASFRRQLGKSIWILGLTSAFGFPLAVSLAPALAVERTSESLCEKYRDYLHAADLVVSEENKDYSLLIALGHRVVILDRPSELGLGFFLENTSPDQRIPDNPNKLDPEEVNSPYFLDFEGLIDVWKSDQVVCLFSPESYNARFQSFCGNAWELGRDDEQILIINRNPADLVLNSASTSDG